MSIYKGRVNCRDLTSFLHTVLTREGFVDVSSEVTTDGRVYRSSSVGNEDLFYMQIREMKSYYLECGIYESYTPNAIPGVPGQFGSGYKVNSVAWGGAVSASNDLHDLDYVINVDKKRLLIYLSAMKSQPARISSVTYLGLPTRLNATDKDGFFAGITGSAFSIYANNHTFYPLRDRSKVVKAPYTLEFYKPNRSYGWGSQLFFSPLFVTKSNEGFRGVLDGLFVIEKTDKNYEVSAGDTFMQDGKNYMVISPEYTGDSLLHPSLFDYILEI